MKWVSRSWGMLSEDFLSGDFEFWREKTDNRVDRSPYNTVFCVQNMDLLSILCQQWSPTECIESVGYCYCRFGYVIHVFCWSYYWLFLQQHALLQFPPNCIEVTMETAAVHVAGIWIHSLSLHEITIINTWYYSVKWGRSRHWGHVVASQLICWSSSWTVHACDYYVQHNITLT